MSLPEGCDACSAMLRTPNVFEMIFTAGRLLERGTECQVAGCDKINLEIRCAVIGREPPHKQLSQSGGTETCRIQQAARGQP